MKPKVLNVRQLCPNKNCLSTGGRWKWEPKGSCVWSRAGNVWGEASRNGGPLHRQCEKCCRRNSWVSMRVTILTTPNNGGFKAWTGLPCNQQCFQWVVGTPTKPQNVQSPICTYKMCWGSGGIEPWKWPNNDWLNLRLIPGEGTSVYPALPTWPGTKRWLLQRTKIEKNQYNDAWQYSYVINQYLTQLPSEKFFLEADGADAETHSQERKPKCRSSYGFSQWSPGNTVDDWEEL